MTRSFWSSNFELFLESLRFRDDGGAKLPSMLGDELLAVLGVSMPLIEEANKGVSYNA